MKGLTSKEALETLESELSLTLDKCRSNKSSWVWDAWWPSSPLSLFRITSVVFSTLMILALTGSSQSTWVDLSTAVVMILLTLVNLVVSGWESYQRSVEVMKRAELLIKHVHNTRLSPLSWESGHYPHLHTPVTSSIVLQWTLRDGDIVNLPWSLLVRGDVILLRPGQHAPAHCSSVDTDQLVKRGEVLCPDSADPHLKFRLLETPYLAEMEAVLEAATKKPLSILTKQRHLLVSSVLEYICTPGVTLLVLATNCVRHMYSWSWLSQPPLSSLFLTDTVCAALPLLPLMFPVWWVLVNTAATANILNIFRQSPVLQTSNTATADPFDDTVEPPDLEQAAPDVPLHTTWNTFWSCLLGRGEHLIR